ncbi:radical SAM protein [Butyrivibrio sp. AE3003]|uniref:radical SAM protein n=1 Tax=Butyrivibrio sp. AE3003 TaxID=1496721 RepID=UPI00047E130F|nr:radical SAM protein [Butyrivibrio sp. AE3003]
MISINAGDDGIFHPPLPLKSQSYSIYIHIPFCIQRCPYCYFTAKYSRDEVQNLSLISKYADAVALDICNTEFPQGKIKNLVFGGGTPSLLDEESIEKILCAIKEKIGEDRFSEIDSMSYEAFPDKDAAEKIRLFRAKGFNRVSFGIQSFIDDELKILGRRYNSEDISKVLDECKRLKYDIVNYDLLVGFPGQDRDSILYNVRNALKYKPEHITLNLYYKNYPGGDKYVSACCDAGRPILSDSECTRAYIDACNLLKQYGYLRLDNTLFTLPDKVFEYERDFISESEELLAFGPGSSGIWNNSIRYTPPYIKEYIENPHHRTKDITLDSNAFQVIWGNLNAYGYVMNKTVVDLFGLNITEIEKKNDAVKILIKSLVDEDMLDYRVDDFYQIREDKFEEAIVIMRNVRDSRFGYNLDTAGEER